jgi:ZU5 domain-containing protein
VTVTYETGTTDAIETHRQTTLPEAEMRTTAMRSLAVVVAGLAIAGCNDRSPVTGPPALTGSAPNRTILSAPTTVHVVSRNSPIASQSASAVIGAFGGRLALPGAGLTVVIPPFAVASPTTITVTAVAGSKVAYEFSPHGTQFLVPLLVSQDLSNTNALPAGLLSGLLSPKFVAGYFTSVSDINQVNGTAIVSELLSTVLSLGTKTVTFPVFHFSGYLVATGNQSTDDGSGSQ